MTVILILVLLILLVLLIGFIYIKTKIQKFSQKWFGTRDIFEGINSQKMKFQEAPKTPYGMDSLILPEINKDFPHMNIKEMKKIAESNIMLAIESVNLRRIQSFSNASEQFKDNIQNVINRIIEENNSLKIERICIHKTVANKYEREESKCNLVFQTAIGYTVNKNGQSQRYEDRINTEFIYVYNYQNIKSHESISLKCPNCGAPVQHLGVKKCNYCNAGIVDLAVKTWVLSEIVRIAI